MDDFIKIYPAKHVTPYMHCMMYHVSEFMQLHESILMFTQQDLEKYNDIMTKDYFWATCHQNEQCLIQILQKQNRLEYLENLGAQPERPNKHTITCSNCKQKGHNKWTCKAPCRYCGISTFQSHLIVQGKSKILQCIVEQ